MTVVDVDSSIVIRRAPEDVFAFAADPGNDPKWHENILAARKVSQDVLGTGSRYVWDADFLGKRQVDVEMTAFDPPRLAAMSLRSGWMKAGVTYIVEPHSEGARVTRRVSLPVPPILGAAKPLVRWYGNQSGEHHVEWLKRALEEGRDGL